MKSVYLAGPITGETFSGASNWREHVREHLAPGVMGLSPMRGYLPRDGKMEDSKGETDMLRSSRALMSRDFFDCQNCDVILANLSGTTEKSTGTTMEIAWAYAFRKPLILVMEASVFDVNGNILVRGNCHEHDMIREATSHRVEDLDDAIFIVNTMLSAYTTGK